MSFLRRLNIDPLVVVILAAVGLATVLPAEGAAAEVLGWATKIGIAVLFFLYGTRLEPQETLRGLRNWRLHLAILVVTFLAFPLIGRAASLALDPVLGAELSLGFLYLCLVPSTVQMSITLVSLSKGNVGGAIVSASLSNLLGVFMTPVLVLLVMATGGGVQIDASSIGTIVLQILVPFVVGQLVRPWVAPQLGKVPNISIFDRAIIVLIVYAAFSRGVVEGIWSQVGLAQIGLLVVACLLLLALIFGLIHLLARALRFDTPDLRALQFCGTQKSLATGLPMAVVLFAGHPIGLLVLPLMIYHQTQLIVGSILATRFGRAAAEPAA